ncbi:uncharacterized protein K452DRAFT_291666 [Aplosporella prunicola CBS 121167]|uniref:Heterokaryon incompatibility domain-containing protein n=1 Tax=Aplosporella prunicola CBS 121167 TaxID=1176127 RepID=A0A6A6B0L5_9PEZI|nr:uncharacterized protein K452DRAFT_291666 [Aplosporella prunicola CBS 121167]KAF2137426.1 hypothetical protein K452DRAFT_291666 [Aplosporella prunicola CBS 121167]
MALPTYSVSCIRTLVKASSFIPVGPSCVGDLHKKVPVRTHNWVLGPGLSYLSGFGKRNAHNVGFDRLLRQRNKPDRPVFEAYPYYNRPLPAHNSIRLLALHPGLPGDSKITTSLEVADFETLPYEALSYVWDDPSALNYLKREKSRDVLLGEDNEGRTRCVIECDGYTIGVTPNLYYALRRLRLSKYRRLLWIDALSINQANNSEKNQQIPLMSMIYANAQQVNVWLGEDSPMMSGALIALSRWAQVWRSTDVVYQPELRNRLVSGGIFPLERYFFQTMIRRAWFTRAWAFQELCLSKHAVLMCSQYSVPWPRFRDACAAVVGAGYAYSVFEEQQNVQTLCDFWDLTRKMPSPESRALAEQFQLSSLIQRTSSQQASDPRDKIYSLVGLASSPAGNTTVRADYNLSVEDTYRIFTRAMIEEDGDLGILSSVKRPRVDQLLEVRALSQGIRPLKGLPSWVPDYQYNDVVEQTYGRHHINGREGPIELGRTRFPQTIAQQNEGLPMYRPSNEFSSRVLNGSIAFDTDDQGQLGVYGKHVGKVRATFSMPFTSDPSLRAGSLSPKEARPERSPPNIRFNFDFREKFVRWGFGTTVLPDPVLEEERYRHTGENTAMAVLRTLTADMLPISHRLPDSYKVTYFPLHYDWYLWNDPKEMLRTILIFLGLSFHIAPPLIFFYLALRSFKLFEANRSLHHRKGNPLKPWNAFDTYAMRWPWKARSVYEDILLDPETSLSNDESHGKDKALKTYRHYFDREKITGAIALSLASVPLIAWSGITFPVLCTLWKYSALAATAQAAVFAALTWRTRHMRSAEPSAEVPAGWEERAARASKHRFWGLACEVQHAVNRTSWNRVFFVTEEGHMGVGPVGMQTGDRVVALVGGGVVYVVRRKLGEDAKGDGKVEKAKVRGKMKKGQLPHELWELVGEAYVHGVMDGEAWGKYEYREWDDLENLKRMATKMVLV